MPDISALLHRHAWWALAALAIGLLAWVAKQTWFFDGPLRRLPLAQRAQVVIFLGILSGVLRAIATGTPWADAVAMGFVSALVAMGVHNVGGGLTGPVRVAPAISLPGEVTIIDSSLRDETPPPAVLRAPEMDFDDGGKP